MTCRSNHTFHSVDSDNKQLSYQVSLVLQSYFKISAEWHIKKCSLQKIYLYMLFSKTCSCCEHTHKNTLDLEKGSVVSTRTFLDSLMCLTNLCHISHRLILLSY